MISIINISQLQDNYSYAILNNKEVIIIDPADSISILRYIEDNQLSLKAILLTHHHTDHTAGVEGILNKIKVPVYSSNKEIKTPLPWLIGFLVDVLLPVLYNTVTLCSEIDRFFSEASIKISESAANPSFLK